MYSVQNIFSSTLFNKIIIKLKQPYGENKQKNYRPCQQNTVPDRPCQQIEKIKPCRAGRANRRKFFNRAVPAVPDHHFFDLQTVPAVPDIQKFLLWTNPGFVALIGMYFVEIIL